MSIILNTLSDSRLVKLLTAGKIGVIPTDTVYGVVARAADQVSVARLYSLKQRHYKPGTIIAASVDQLVELGIKRRYLTAVEQYWPNPISIEIPHDIDYLNQETGRQAFRVVADQAVAELLLQTGPLVTSSANQPGQPPATTLAEAEAYFAQAVDFYVEGGDLSDRPASTIIRVIDDAVEVVRPGAITIDEAGQIV